MGSCVSVEAEGDGSDIVVVRVRFATGTSSAFLKIRSDPEVGVRKW